MEKISFKKKVVHLGGWQSRLEPVDAICGVNDTGSFSDSPCPTKTALEELSLVKMILRKNKIQFKSIILPTSNIFCVARYIVVKGSEKEKAIELISHLTNETRLLYIN